MSRIFECKVVTHRNGETNVTRNFVESHNALLV